MNARASKKFEPYQINTLGCFSIMLGEESILDRAYNSYKMLALLKYLLTFREKKLLPEIIIDDICCNSESSDPKNAFRTQVFRLRRTLEDVFDKENQGYMNIKFIGGYYLLSLGVGIKLDIDEFEKKVLEANNLKFTNKEKAIELYKEAIELYKGDYLSEDNFDWLIPIRNYYNRLYIHSIYYLIEAYKEAGDYQQIIDICEKAMKYEADEEILHINFMDALLELGHINQALSHFEFVTAWLSKELQVKPSKAMKEIHRRIQSFNQDKGLTDLRRISQEIEDKPKQGPIMCNREDFNLLQNLALRKRNRHEKTDYLILITLDTVRRTEINQEKIKGTMKILEQVIQTSLRKGDAYTFCNNIQITLIITEVNEINVRLIKDRITKKFIKAVGNDCFRLVFNSQPIEENEIMLNILQA